MVKILFVCHGNICRSPMAEFLMKDLVAKRGLAAQFEIASAATSREEIGNPVHPGTRKKLEEHHISCAGKRAVQLTKKDYDHYDYLIGMDRYNLINMRRIVENDPKGKLHLILDFPNLFRDVADPWYTDDFDQTYDDILLGCTSLLDAIISKNEL